MPLTDYVEIADRMQKTLAGKYDNSPDILNRPGLSLACKIDPHYYLAVEPLFVEKMARWCGMLPGRITETLKRTGNVIIGPEEQTHVLQLSVTWPGERRGMKVAAMFLLADFVDRALAMYASSPQLKSFSDLRIHEVERPRIEQFFAGNTLPGDFVFSV